MKRVRYACGLLAVGAVLTLVGCGKSMNEVKGVVTLDGKPVDGAMVLFTGDDGTLASGFTDANGNFELSSGPNSSKGAPDGVYRVTVTKVKTIEGAISPKEAAESGGDTKAATKAMEKMAKAAKAGGGAKGGPPMPGMPKGGGAGGSNSLLPEMYGSPDLTPFKNIKIPADGPVKLELTGGGGGPGGPPGKK